MPCAEDLAPPTSLTRPARDTLSQETAPSFRIQGTWEKRPARDRGGPLSHLGPRLLDSDQAGLEDSGADRRVTSARSCPNFRGLVLPAQPLPSRGRRVTAPPKPPRKLAANTRCTPTPRKTTRRRAAPLRPFSRSMGPKPLPARTTPLPCRHPRECGRRPGTPTRRLLRRQTRHQGVGPFWRADLGHFSKAPKVSYDYDPTGPRWRLGEYHPSGSEDDVLGILEMAEPRRSSPQRVSLQAGPPTATGLVRR